MVKERSPHKIKTWAQVLPETGLLVVTGFRGEGKSALAWKLAEDTQAAGRRVAAFDFTKGARKALPRWVKHVSTVAEVAKLAPAVLVVDEGALKIHARRAMSAENVEWTRLLAICRHKGHLVILLCQHQRQVDVQMVMDADVLVFKRPSLFHVRAARPEFRQEVEEAFAGFQNGHRPSQEWAYVVRCTDGAKGWLRCVLPTFWSEKLSKAFALVDLEGVEVEAKRKRQNAARGARRAA